MPHGGTIDRSKKVRFRWDNVWHTGYEGETLASALLANGHRIVARSFKLHRPRGLMAAGLEEANALVSVDSECGHHPNRRATEVPMIEGLSARSQNAWPHVLFDIAAVLDLLSRWLPSGFYYKTFMWPSWHTWEPLVRKFAGLGHSPKVRSTATTIESHIVTDVLVVGGGPAGLAAAVAAQDAGHDVLLIEQSANLGGSLAWRSVAIEGASGPDWCSEQVNKLESGTAKVRTSTQVTALFEGNRAIACVQTLGMQTQLLNIQYNKVVIATGATERPLMFPNNDRPGVFLASAACEYAVKYGVAIGKSVVVVTNQDDGWFLAEMLERAGVNVSQLLDARDTVSPALPKLKAPHAVGVRIAGTSGYRGVRRIDWKLPNGELNVTSCDAVAVHGGWNPVSMLASNEANPLEWSDRLNALIPKASNSGNMAVVGGARGILSSNAAVQDGAEWERTVRTTFTIPTNSGSSSVAINNAAVKGLWVDLQSDVTLGDIDVAYREGMSSVEHLKRYTTLGMAPDQGRTSRENGLAALSALCGSSLRKIGSTRARPPVFPIPLGVLAASKVSTSYRPIKALPAASIHAQLGAKFEEYGGWLRPAYYPQVGETEVDAINREASIARRGVVVMEASPLGKIEVIGPDATEFLERIYATGVATLKPGRTRYGLMLNDRGIIIDDGVLSCIDSSHYIVGTTSGGVSRIVQHLEEWHQTEWPNLRVVIQDVTTQWGVITVSGPDSFKVVQRLGLAMDTSSVAFPHLAFAETSWNEVPARIQRVSFTGEVSFEIMVPQSKTEDLWRKIWRAGEDLDIAPLGIESLMALRIEKGYLHVGSDTDATTTPDDVGYGTPVRRKSAITIGRRGLDVPAMSDAQRLQLIGLLSENRAVLPIGSHILPNANSRPPTISVGHVTSSAYGPALGRGVALGMLRGGRSRMGETVYVWANGMVIPATVQETCFYDKTGERLKYA